MNRANSKPRKYFQIKKPLQNRYKSRKTELQFRWESAGISMGEFQLIYHKFVINELVDWILIGQLNIELHFILNSRNLKLELTKMKPLKVAMPKELFLKK